MIVRSPACMLRKPSYKGFYVAAQSMLDSFTRLEEISVALKKHVPTYLKVGA